MNAASLIMHPISARIYASIPARADVMALAKKYSAIVWFKDEQSENYARAIEWHLRDVCRYGRLSDESMKALSIMERAKMARANERRKKPKKKKTKT